MHTRSISSRVIIILVAVPHLPRWAMRLTRWSKPWPICEPQQALVSDVVQHAKLLRTLQEQLADLPLRHPRNRPLVSRLRAGMLTTAIPPRSSLGPTLLHSLARAPPRPHRLLPRSCNRRHRHPHLSWMPSLIRTTKASLVSAVAGPTVVVQASMPRHWHRRLPMAMAFIWIAQSAVTDTLAS